MDIEPIPADPAQLLPALRTALSGSGPAIAPVPDDSAARRRTLDAIAAGEPLRKPCAVVLLTSGSTGRPKGVRLSAAALISSAEATHAWLGGAGQWWLALPVSSVAGLQVVTRSIVAGTEPVADPGDFDGRRPRYASLVPTQLHRLVAERPEAVRSCDAILVGGGPVDPALVAAAHESAPDTRIVATYGMTETCGGCVYDGEPLPGVEVSIKPETDRIVLAGPMLADGYRGADHDASFWVDGGQRRFRTSDRGAWASGKLRVLGRVDDVVITGGVKVPLDVVTDAVRSLPGCGNAVCLGVPDVEWGARVVAFIAQGNHDLSLRGIRDAVATTVPRTWAPRQLVVVQEWPMLANGKLDRRALISMAQQPSQA